MPESLFHKVAGSRPGTLLISCFGTSVFCGFCKILTLFFTGHFLATVIYDDPSNLCGNVAYCQTLHFMSFLGQRFVRICFRELVLWQFLGLFTEAAHPEEFVGKDFLKSTQT